MKQKITKLLFLLFFGIIFTSQAQQAPINGVVADSNGVPLPGASILVKGTINGTSSDFDGNFSINASKDDIIVISFIGYDTKEVIVSNQTSINVVLTQDMTQLDDVVVIGYGSVKKSDLTGSVASISSKNFNKGGVIGVEGLIQGRAAGVQVTTASAAPGGDVMIRIRGNNSVNSDNSPLYVVDGFPMKDLENSINPSDIKTINILKDASATAIYGTRGANGVIIITTKRGVEGKSKITLSSETSVTSVDLKAYDFTNATEYATLTNANDVLSGNAETYSPEAFVRMQELGLGTNWLEEAFRTGRIQNHEISVTGGNKDTKVFFSGGLYNYEGNVKNTDFSRVSIRMNLDQNLLDGNLKLGVNTSLSTTQTNFQGFTSSALQDNILRGIFRSNPLVPANPSDYDNLSSEDKQLLFGGARPVNPIETLFISKNESNRYFVLTNAFLELKILEGLKFKTAGGARISNSKTKRFLPSTSTLVASSVEPGSAQIGHELGRYYIFENTLNYDKQIEKHSFNVLVGATNEWNDPEYFTAGSKDYTTDALEYNALQSGATPLTPTSGGIANKLASYLARVNYSYDDKYLVTFTYRRDGSSKFGKGNKWGDFPAAAIAWNMHNENFIDDDSKISTLKLRTSYGITGNDRFTPGSAQSTFAANGLVTTDGSTLSVGTVSERIGNTDLQWEETAQFDLGLELGLFNDRLFFELGAYQKSTSNLLLDKQVAASQGVAGGTILVNAGEVQNRGIELLIDSKNISNADFSWSTLFNFSYNDNEIKKLILPEGATFLPGGYAKIDGTLEGNYTILKEGLPINTLYGYKYLGVLQDGETAPAHQPGLIPGQAKFADVNGDGKFDSLDKDVLGNGYPKYSLGLTNSFRYKGFNLSIFLSGLIDVDKINGNNVIGSTFNTLTLANEKYNLDNNQNAGLPSAWIGDQWINDYTVESATFIRLKNISLSYDFNTQSPTLNWLSSLQIYATGTNLLTWDSYSGFDPEVNSVSDNSTNLNVAAGLDTYSYPNTRTFSLGLKLGL